MTDASLGPVLITGGGGFLGRALTARLLDAGETVVTLDLSPATGGDPRATHLGADIREGAALLQLQRPSEAATRFERALELARRAPAGDARQRAAAEKARVGLEMARKN